MKESKEEKKEYEIRYLDKEGREVYQKGVINDEPSYEILKQHAREFPEPRVVFFNGKLTNL